MKEDKKIFQIVCPAGKGTGGLELLHQMAFLLSQDGHKVEILYWPTFKKHELVKQYAEYLENVKVTETFSDNESSIIILPEVYSYFVRKIKKAKIVFWWLSVDNYINSKSFKFALANMFVPFTYWNFEKNDRVLHAVQSEYARLYLEQRKIVADYEISDYINDEYLSELSQKENLLPDKRENIVLYNPAKGGEEQKRLVQFLEKKYTCVALRGFDKQSMIKVLGKAKVYIDFGEHPGKDRIPRETASLGCCIITNTKGSAENEIDVAIPNEYKFKQEGEYFQKVDYSINKIFDNFEAETKKFDLYRKKIINEKELFSNAVKLFGRELSV